MSFCGWFSGEQYRDHFETGVYACKKCGYELFHSSQKYEHSSPWPAFTKLINPDSVSRTPESKSAMKIHCGKCGNGLGHEFLGDGPKKGTNRY
ncbi:Methionine-R-sulfoxide reductase B1 [Mizuhopecten yessoensis]|uniref:peptide-methionine (R)-S-oxide reductase n=2 Tax=Mizuhopecten yessoensis TaxID=6573 RepID=A0A210QBJ1_MIZYE|nr:Methionine-R-sulfoxide reductase B1 [Mizuhopecten yessoensis]